MNQSQNSLQISIRPAYVTKGVFEVSERVIGQESRDRGSVHDRTQSPLESDQGQPRFVAFCHDHVLGGILDTDNFVQAVKFAVYGQLAI